MSRSRNAQVADVVRGRSWPLNSSGVFILERVGHRLDVVVREFAEAFDLPLDVARFDALQFIWTLNALALVNVKQSGSRLRRAVEWLGLALRLAPAGALPGPDRPGLLTALQNRLGRPVNEEELEIVEVFFGRAEKIGLANQVPGINKHKFGIFFKTHPRPLPNWEG